MPRAQSQERPCQGKEFTGTHRDGKEKLSGEFAWKPRLEREGEGAEKKETSGQVTQDSDRQTGTWAGPEGQARPALDNVEDHLGTPVGPAGWAGEADPEGSSSFGLGNPDPPHLPLADKD